MIRSWRNSAARKVWDGERPNQFRGLDFEVAVDLLLALNVAKSLGDLSPLRSVGLHKLKGDRRGQWAMTVNDRWRICFEFRKGDAHRSKSWITTEVERYGSCCTPRPFVEARNGRSKAQCEPSVARYRRAVRPHHRHPQWPPRDHGRYRRAARPVFPQQRAVLAGPAGSI